MARKSKAHLDLKKVSGRNKKIKKQKLANKENPFKRKVLNTAASILLKAASFAANAALYNKEVSKRVSKRSHEALQIVSELGKLAQNVKSDVKAGIKAANEVRAKKPKKNLAKKLRGKGRPRKS